jgi:hypothetical protein
LIEAATRESKYGVDASASVALFIIGQSWSAKEARRRISHALSLLKKTPKEDRERAARMAQKVISEHLN